MSPFTPRCILVATDFSDLSALALRHAVRWAQQFGSELQVVHAREPFPIVDSGYFCNYSPEVDQVLGAAAAEELRKCVREDVPPGVPVTAELITGSPADVIEACAAEKGIDLVVVGTHGRGGFSRMILGSVAERVLRLACHPTLIVRHSPADKEPGPPEVRHVLCPVNYTEVACRAVHHACGAAHAFGARMTAVFIVEPKEGHPPDLPAEEERLRAWLASGGSLPCEMKLVVGHGDAAEQVITLARELPADLVVIGAQHRRFVDTTVLGVTTVRVTRHAPCPGLVVPHANGTP
jgi:nucleotide-binding universal stress UspA family protein